MKSFTSLSQFDLFRHGLELVHLFLDDAWEVLVVVQTFDGQTLLRLLLVVRIVAAFVRNRVAAVPAQLLLLPLTSGRHSDLADGQLTRPAESQRNWIFCFQF